MAVKSYVIIPNKGGKDRLRVELSSIPECEVTSAENKDVLIVVTETRNEKEDQVIFEKLTHLQDVQLLTLVSAFSE